MHGPKRQWTQLTPFLLNIIVQGWYSEVVMPKRPSEDIFASSEKTVYLGTFFLNAVTSISNALRILSLHNAVDWKRAVSFRVTNAFMHVH